MSACWLCFAGAAGLPQLQHAPAAPLQTLTAHQELAATPPMQASLWQVSALLAASHCVWCLCGHHVITNHPMCVLCTCAVRACIHAHPPPQGLLLLSHSLCVLCVLCAVLCACCVCCVCCAVCMLCACCRAPSLSCADVSPLPASTNLTAQTAAQHCSPHHTRSSTAQRTHTQRKQRSQPSCPPPLFTVDDWHYNSRCERHTLLPLTFSDLFTAGRTLLPAPVWGGVQQEEQQQGAGKVKLQAGEYPALVAINAAVKQARGRFVFLTQGE